MYRMFVVFYVIMRVLWVFSGLWGEGVSSSLLGSLVRLAFFRSFCRAARASQSSSAAILACSGQVEGSVKRSRFGFSVSSVSLILSMSVDASFENDVIPASLSTADIFGPIPSRVDRSSCIVFVRAVIFAISCSFSANELSSFLPIVIAASARVNVLLFCFSRSATFSS